MNTFLQWIDSHTKTVHGIAVGATSLAILISVDTSFRDLILKLFASHAKIGSDIVVLACIVAAYSKSRKGQ